VRLNWQREITLDAKVVSLTKEQLPTGTQSKKKDKICVSKTLLEINLGNTVFCVTRPNKTMNLANLK
jgi:hypothetical protein